MTEKHDRTPTEQAYLDYANRKITYPQYRARLEEIRKQVQENFEQKFGKPKGEQNGRYGRG